jgi:hypothetical protein
VSQEEATRFADKHNLVYFETSAKTSQNVEDVFTSVADRVLEGVQCGRINAKSEVG